MSDMDTCKHRWADSPSDAGEGIYCVVCGMMITHPSKLQQEVERLKAFREAVVGWRENDWPEYFCRRTAEMVADRGREAEDADMNGQKTGWHKLNYHERGERITELEQEVARLRKELTEANRSRERLRERLDKAYREAEIQTSLRLTAEARLNRLLERLQRRLDIEARDGNRWAEQCGETEARLNRLLRQLKESTEYDSVEALWQCIEKAKAIIDAQEDSDDTGGNIL